MMAFKMASDQVKYDAPLEYFNTFMEKHKAMAPEDFKGAWDHDKKLEPPEIEYDDDDMSSVVLE
jgi:hypothetical protein